MSTILALTKLYDDVVARMDADALAAGATVVPQAFGWRSPAQQPRAPRIVWVPGDDTGGALGDVRAARSPGRNARPLVTLGELFTVYLEAVDTTAPEDERAQYQAARELFDAWLRAVYLAARGTFQIRAASWVIERKERRYGATVRVLGEIEAMVPDAAFGVAPVDTRGEIDVDELDASETLTPPPRVLVATTAAIALSGVQTIDGLELAVGDRVLVREQADPAEHGLYTVASGAWTRTADVLASGFVVHVNYGDTWADVDFEITTADPITPGVTPITFERISP